MGPRNTRKGTELGIRGEGVFGWAHERHEIHESSGFLSVFPLLPRWQTIAFVSCQRFLNRTPNPNRISLPVRHWGQCPSIGLWFLDAGFLNPGMIGSLTEYAEGDGNGMLVDKAEPSPPTE